jgi:beta-glucosidase
MPKTLYYGPKFLYERYQKPIIISENGISVIDVLTQDHKIHDYARIEYYRRYLEQMEKAQKDGIPIKGYFAWSLFDNFEWAFGYSARFGLIYVDYQSMKRYPKDSFYFYQKYIADHQE